jgi:hypothetical protein
VDQSWSETKRRAGFTAQIIKLLRPEFNYPIRISILQQTIRALPHETTLRVVRRTIKVV